MAMDPIKLQMFEEMMVFFGLMGTLLAVTSVSIFWIRRRGQSSLPPDVTRKLDEISDRLGRLENAVDSSALEIERISEGQRFTTKVLAERSGVSGGSGSR